MQGETVGVSGRRFRPSRYQQWRLARRFRRRMGYECNLDEPQTIYEKFQYRKLFGNHEFYASIADKYLARDYIASKVGQEYLVPLLAVADRLTPQLLAELPDGCIIKANHGCKWQRIVRDKSQLDVPGTIRYFDRLLSKTWGYRNGEFHYGLIKPRIVVEELLSSYGEIPCNYAFYCHHGSAGFRHMLTVSHSDPVQHVAYDDDWNLLLGDVTPQFMERYYKPANYDRMVEIARTLSSDFDFVRVDMYNIDGRIYCGEMTLVPGSGMKPISHQDYLTKRTQLWQLDVDNELLYHRRKCA